MAIEKPDYNQHAEAPGSTKVKELEMMKVSIVTQVTGSGVKFPIRTRDELLGIFPKSTPMACEYKGNRMMLYDLIQHLDGSDFPINNAGDLATLLTSRCPV